MSSYSKAEAWGTSEELDHAFMPNLALLSNFCHRGVRSTETAETSLDVQRHTESFVVGISANIQ